MSGTETYPETGCNIVEGENPFTGSKLIYFPPGEIYPTYAADPVRVGFGIQPVHVTKTSIPQTSKSRVNLRAGGELGVLRSQPLDPSDRSWQLSLMGGFNDQNDVAHSLDNIGWDGHYGLLITTASEAGPGFKLGLLHVSSHVGDEYMQRTGRLRIGYTRQELAAGVSWFTDRRWRWYAETGRAFSLGNPDLQKLWRAQAGVEYESSPLFWKHVSWYAALDSQSWQERDWRIDVAIQTGLVVHSTGRAWRLGAEWYNGRPPIGEFFQNTERYISFGLWIDI